MTLALWQHASVATLCDTALNPSQGKGDIADWGFIDDGAVLTQGGRIVWVGARDAIPADLRAQVSQEHDMQGALLTPGLIDCHTHLVYGGHRAHEFELRLQGASYEDIARAGGGIRSTVTATREYSDEALLASATERAHALMREGVCTVEVKSGYGLSLEHEARCLRVARRLGQSLPLSVQTTCLSAHALPPEYAGRADAYIDAVCNWLPALHAEGLMDAVDVFCDTIGFTRAQTQRVFAAARALGLPVKLHAEQLSDQNGAALAASFNALSCDHLEHLSSHGIAAMAAAGTVAVLLPGAYYFLRETQLPPVQALVEAGVPIAIATDHNPGSSPTLSPLLMLNMACTLFRMTPLQALRGFTVHAAKALGLKDRGQLAAGQRADFAVWEVAHPRELAYWFGRNPCSARVVAGKEVRL
jgi:imidazolonepropionase